MRAAPAYVGIFAEYERINEWRRSVFSVMQVMVVSVFMFVLVLVGIAEGSNLGGVVRLWIIFHSV